MDLSIAIPDSSLQDESTLLYKTKKISIIARACAIFKIKQIFIYKDKEIMIPISDDFIELFDFKNKVVIVKNSDIFINKC